MSTTPDMHFEQEAHTAGYRTVCGIDEAGRGPLAGPVVTAAVVLPDGFSLPGLNDSKQLSARQREALYEALMQDAPHKACLCLRIFASLTDFPCRISPFPRAPS